MKNELSIILVTIGILFTCIGGILDISETSSDMSEKKNSIISKEHFWNDGIFLVTCYIHQHIYTFGHLKQKYK